MAELMKTCLPVSGNMTLMEKIPASITKMSEDL